MGNNIILETKFVADIRGSFYIPSYQRGYRWSETEVAILFVIVMDSLHKATAATFLICCTCISPQMKRKQ